MNGSLFLSPQNVFGPSFDINKLRQLLQEIQLIGKNWKQNRFFCGETFLQQITFMGCSPYLEFEPGEEKKEDFCFVILHDHPEVQLLTGQQTAPPRCPACRYRISDWKNLLPDWQQADKNFTWTCPKCSQDSHPGQLDWRQSGGAGNQFIEIRNIFPGEAVPVDSLMKKLADFSAEQWQYFYTTD